MPNFSNARYANIFACRRTKRFRSGCAASPVRSLPRPQHGIPTHPAHECLCASEAGLDGAFPQLCSPRGVSPQRKERADLDRFQPADRPLSVRCLDWRSATLAGLVAPQSTKTLAGHGVTRPKTFPIPFQPLRTMWGAMPVPRWSGRCLRPVTPKKLHVWRTRERNSDCPMRSTRCPRCIARSAPETPRDLSYTKPNFIRHLIAAHNKPVLYLDADCEFRSESELIAELVRSRCDFAIYHGFADAYADRFVPVEHWSGAKEPPVPNRYYRFAGNIGFCSERQLFCVRPRSALSELACRACSARAMAPDFRRLPWLCRRCVPQFRLQ